MFYKMILPWANDLPAALQTVDPDNTKTLSAVTAVSEVDGGNVRLSEWTGQDVTYTGSGGCMYLVPTLCLTNGGMYIKKL